MSWILSGVIVQPRTWTKWINYQAFWPHKNPDAPANVSLGKTGDFSVKKQHTLTSCAVTLESESKLNSSCCPQSDRVIWKGLCSRLVSPLATSLDTCIHIIACQAPAGSRDRRANTNPEHVGRGRDFPNPLPRLPKCENDAADNSESEVPHKYSWVKLQFIFSCQWVWELFLRADFQSYKI